MPITLNLNTRRTFPQRPRPDHSSSGRCHFQRWHSCCCGDVELFKIYCSQQQQQQEYYCIQSKSRVKKKVRRTSLGQSITRITCFGTCCSYITETERGHGRARSGSDIILREAFYDRVLWVVQVSRELTSTHTVAAVYPTQVAGSWLGVYILDYMLVSGVDQTRREMSTCYTARSGKWRKLGNLLFSRFLDRYCLYSNNSVNATHSYTQHTHIQTHTATPFGQHNNNA